MLGAVTTPDTPLYNTPLRVSTRKKKFLFFLALVLKATHVTGSLFFFFFLRGLMFLSLFTLKRREKIVSLLSIEGTCDTAHPSSFSSIPPPLF
jgi:hypothetical protein